MLWGEFGKVNWAARRSDHDRLVPRLVDIRMSKNEELDSLPGEIPARSVLYLATADAALLRELISAARKVGFRCDTPLSGVWAIPFRSDEATTLFQALVLLQNEATSGSLRCRLLAQGDLPTAAELMRSHSLSRFLDWLAGQWIAELLAEERLVTYFQPIVNCVTPDRVFAYECLTRGRQADGRLIPPDRLYSAARATGRLAALDAAARRTALKTIAARSLATHAFVNINPRSIEDPAECVEVMLRAALESGLECERFVFEVVESDEIVDSDQLERLLGYFREAGFRVALDDLGAGYSSLNLLAAIKPDFVKIDMGLIRGVDRDRYKGQVASKLLELARDLGVRTVVEGVETREEWQWSRDHGADFAQGYLFARPQADPPTVALPSVPAKAAAIADTAVVPVVAVQPP